MTDPLVEDLSRLAPDVDVRAAHDLFTRRRAGSFGARHPRGRWLVSAVAAVLVAGMVIALVAVVGSDRSPRPTLDPTPVATSVGLPPTPSTSVPSTTPPSTVPSTTAAPTTVASTSAPTTSVVVAAFGEVAPIADASIFYLPDPMPAGWMVSGVINGVAPDDDSNSSGDLETTPPVADGTFHSFSLWMTKSDGSALARLHITEYPFPAEMPDLSLFPESPFFERVDVGGVPRDHIIDSPNSEDGYPFAVLPGFESHDLWSWVQDGRQFVVEMIGAADDVIAMLTALRPVTGAHLGTAIAEGRRAMLELPELASTVLADGVRLTARGAGRTVLGVCAESAIPTCGSIAEVYGVPGVAMTMAATSAGPQEVGWLPPGLAGPLAPGPIVIDGGPLGSFAFDFAELMTVGIDSGSGLQGYTSIGWARTDLLGMPNIDGNLPTDAQGMVIPT
jgi:hypothetical protein